MWERFSYYGMRALFTLFLTASVTADNPGFGWDNTEALSLYGWYTMMVYVASIPGGILADKWLGQKQAVMVGGLLLCLGHLTLALESVEAFYAGCMLIIMGVGCLKPNISSMVGGLYRKGDIRRDQGFYIFYIGINIGAFLSGIIVGYVGEQINWHYGFGLAGIGMLIGQITYVWGQKYLKDVGLKPQKIEQAKRNEPSMSSRLLKMPVLLICTLAFLAGSAYVGINLSVGYGILFTVLTVFFAIGGVIYQTLSQVEKDRVMVMLLTFIIIIIFFGAFEQAGGLMNLYARQKTDRLISIFSLDIIFILGIIFLLVRGVMGHIKKAAYHGAWYIGSATLTIVFIWLRLNVFTTGPNPSNFWQVPAAVFQSVNSFFIFTTAISIAAAWQWWIRKGREASDIFKIAIGVIITGSGFLFMAAAVKEYQISGSSAMYWLVLAYLFHTIGELCTSTVALSFVTKLAPLRYGSVMMGIYFAATGLGNKLAGVAGELSQELGELETFIAITAFWFIIWFACYSSTQATQKAYTWSRRSYSLMIINLD